MRAQRPEPGRVPVLHRPQASYYLLLSAVGLLMTLGLVMVFSASSVRSYATYESSFTIATKQAVFLGLGVPIMLVGARLPVTFWRRVSYPALLGSLALLVLVLVPGIGKNIDGSTRWIPLPGGFNLQPSEFAKLALVLWGADLLVRKKALLHETKHILVPLVPVTCLVLLLIMLEPDLGTTMATSTVVVALLFVVGTPLRWFGALIAALVGVAAVLSVTAEYRLARVLSFVDPCSAEHRLEGGYQACQGFIAMGSGGFFGLGLGASRQKWAGGLPNAHTDYVFAIIGEELGLLGTLTVLLLLATLVYSGIRIASRTTDPFARLAASGVTAWLGAQGLINIGAVLGLLPITGIPMPLVSHGGSALLVSCAALGMLLSFARSEPGAREALAARRTPWQRLTGRRPAPTRSSRAARPARPARPRQPVPGQAVPGQRGRHREPARREPARREPARREPVRR